MPRPRTRAYARDTISLPITALQKRGALRAGATVTCRWSKGSPAVKVSWRGAGLVELHGETKRGPWSRSVRYELARCGAGERPWWLCPVCGRRCIELWLRAGWACRQCQGIAYGVQSESPERRAWRGVVKAARRISPDANPRSPERPPGMRRTYYDKLWSRWWEAYCQWESEDEQILRAQFYDLAAHNSALRQWWLERTTAGGDAAIARRQVEHAALYG